MMKARRGASSSDIPRGRTACAVPRKASVRNCARMRPRLARAILRLERFLRREECQAGRLGSDAPRSGKTLIAEGRHLLRGALSESAAPPCEPTLRSAYRLIAVWAISPPGARRRRRRVTRSPHSRLPRRAMRLRTHASAGPRLPHRKRCMPPCWDFIRCTPDSC
jgi:hypothetical protein